MASIEPAGLNSGDEKLRSVGVGTSVGHAQKTSANVVELKVLIGKLFAVNGLSSSSGAVRKVTALKHEIGNDTMELGALVGERLTTLSHALFASAESAKVLGRLGDDIVEESKSNAASRLAINLNVKVSLAANLGMAGVRL